MKTMKKVRNDPIGNLSLCTNNCRDRMAMLRWWSCNHILASVYNWCVWV